MSCSFDIGVSPKHKVTEWLVVFILFCIFIAPWLYVAFTLFYVLAHILMKWMN